MTFAQLWKSLKVTWQSRPFALLLPLAALGWFFYTHGHKFVLATVANGGSLPTWQELVAGAALLGTKFERLTALFFGEHDPATLPPPVEAPLLAKPPQGPPPVVGFLFLLGLAFTLQACALFQKKVDATIADIDKCISSDEAQDVKDLKHAAGQFLAQVLMCDAEAGFTDIATLPACAAEALPGIEASLGPDGKAFVVCALTNIEADPNALAKQKARAKAMRAKVERSR